MNFQSLDVRAGSDGKERLYLPGTDRAYEGPTISASALDTFDDCKHKWALSRLDNVQRPDTLGAIRGTTAHAQLEGWLLHGTKPGSKDMANVLVHFPSPGECEAEQRFGFIMGEVVFSGYTDARVPGLVQDLKTTSSKDWIKTAAQLMVNVQAAVYAVAEMLRMSTQTCNMKWVYAVTPRPRDEADAKRETFSISHVQPVDFVLTWDQAVATLSHYLPMADAMVAAIERSATAAEFPKTAAACEAYGGCPYKKTGACEAPTGSGLFALIRQEKERNGNMNKTGEKKMESTSSGGLAARFAKKPAATAKLDAVLRGAGTNGAAVLAQIVEAGTAMTAAPKLEHVAATVAAKAGAATEAVSGSLLARMRGLAGAKQQAEVTKAVEAAQNTAPRSVGINPPDAAPEWTPEQQAAEAAKLGGDDKRAKGVLPADSVTQQTAEETKAQIAATQAEEKAQKEAAKAEKKAKKEAAKAEEKLQKLAAKAAEKAKAAMAAAPSGADGPVADPAGQVVGQVAGPFVLLLDCAMTKGAGVLDTSALIDPVRRELEAEMDVENYRLIEYNKGPGLLSFGLERALEKTKPAGMFLADSRTLDREVLAALISKADFVIRGLA